jgi:hypothetical protein
VFFSGGQVMKRSSLLMFLVCALTLLFGVAPLVQADWDPGDSYKMHYPQLPMIYGGWDVCLCCQWVADDFVCSETGPITDIHFWVSFKEDMEFPLNDPAMWDITIRDDAGGMPGAIRWAFSGGNIVTRPYGGGAQGWLCPSPPPPPLAIPPFPIPDHYDVYQVNITDLLEPMIQQQDTTYWLVIKANLPWMPPPSVGWKQATSVHQSPAMYDFGMGWMPIFMATPDTQGIHDLAFVITGGEDELDFGDAPEQNIAGGPTQYPTKLVNDGARHVADGVNYLGQLEDIEPDGQPTLAADGDDINPLAADDEDGVTFVNGGLTAGVGEPVDVFVSPVGLWGGYLNVWIDFNADLDWDDAGEYVFVDQPVAGGMNNLTITAPAGSVVGPTYARFRYTTYPIAGILGYSGQASDGEVEDYCVVIREEPEKEYTKWIQRPHGPEQGFDEQSNIWIHEGTEIIKWEQPPDPQLSGLHSHDYGDPSGYYGWVKCADDFLCQGGDITDLHWWGNYENNDPKGGIAFFHLSLHRCGLQPLPWHLPMEPEVWGWDVPFNMCNQTDTGMVNNMGEVIYSYKVDLPDPYPQIEGEWYWLDVMAKSNDPVDAAIWRWQEARRGPAPPMGHAPAAQRTDSSPWTSITWPGDPERYSDMAFAITSQYSTPVPEVNKVVADDFVSDGRVIKKVRWWGSYFDDRYEPFINPIEPWVVDGWIISFHHTQDIDGTNLACPPDIMAGSLHPTALGLYFAPAYAVEIMPMGYLDCHGHNVYGYKVDLSQCCLICQEVDPRSGTVPAQIGAFNEEECFKYWLDIVAVVGATWEPIAGADCDMIYTGHLPSDMTADGRFWGWHTSPDACLKQACSGQIVDMTPPTPNCWDYGNWSKVMWQCPTPVQPPVNMSFELITPEEEPATCFVGTQAEFAVWCGWGQPANWCGDCWRKGDINGDCLITFSGDVMTAFTDLKNPTSADALTGRSDYNMDGLITFSGDVMPIFINLKNRVTCPVPCTPLP